jgi:hypothetical protein
MRQGVNESARLGRRAQHFRLRDDLFPRPGESSPPYGPISSRAFISTWCAKCTLDSSGRVARHCPMQLLRSSVI